MNRKPILYVLCGIPGCGKSTWAEGFIREHAAEDIRYVSRDEIRFALLKEGEDYFAHEDEVFRKFAGTLYQTLVDGFDVVADATHLNRRSRNKLTRAIDNFGVVEYNIIYIYFNIPLEVCLERNAQRTGRAFVAEDTMRSMYNNMRAPERGEDPRCIGIWEVGGN